MAYSFAADETISEAFARTAREELELAQTSLTERINDDPVKAIHEARKSVKKERALLRLMRGAIKPRDRKRENAALRDAAQRLSGTRDADVMVATLEDLSRRYAGQAPHHTFDALRARLAQQRPATVERPGDAPEARAAAELAAVSDRVAHWELRREGWQALEGGLLTTYERGQKAFARARKHPDPENLHEWRKRVKDLWYHLRVLAEVCGEAVGGGAEDAHALADLLGDDHDLAVLRETLVRVGHDVAADLDAVLGLVDHRRDELEREAMLVGRRVYAERPAAFRRRLRACWRAGRDIARDAQRHHPVELAEAARQLIAS